MYKKISVVASAVVWILLPKCSACLMAYMGLFSALGLGHFINTPYTLPAIKIALFINVVATLYLAIKAKQYMYAVISFVCANIFFINKIYMDSMPLNIVTGVVLVGAALRIRLTRVSKRRCAFSCKEAANC